MPFRHTIERILLKVPPPTDLPITTTVENIAIPPQTRVLLDHNPLSAHQTVIREEFADAVLRRRSRAFLTERGEWRHDKDKYLMRDVEHLHAELMEAGRASGPRTRGRSNSESAIPTPIEVRMLHALSLFGRLRLEAQETALLLEEERKENVRLRAEIVRAKCEWVEKEAWLRSEVENLKSSTAQDDIKIVGDNTTGESGIVEDRGAHATKARERKRSYMNLLGVKGVTSTRRRVRRAPVPMAIPNPSNTVATMHCMGIISPPSSSSSTVTTPESPQTPDIPPTLYSPTGGTPDQKMDQKLLPHLKRNDEAVSRQFEATANTDPWSVSSNDGFVYFDALQQEAPSGRPRKGSFL